MSKRSSFALVALLGLGAACGPTLHGLRHDPDFTYERLVGDGLAVGGVVSLVHETDDPRAFAAQYANMLSRELSDDYANITSSGRVRVALGEATQDAMLESFRLAGILDDSSLTKLGNALAADARYCAFARMEDDVTSNTTEESVSEEDKVKYRVTKYVTRRTLRVEFTIYDLQRYVSVWSAMLEGTDSKANTYKDPIGAAKEDEDVIDAVAGAVVDAIRHADREYPDAPELTRVTEAVFAAFVNALPDPPKKKK